MRQHKFEKNSLVSEWVKCEIANGYSLQNMIDIMNNELETKVTNSRVREWQRLEGRGARLPKPVREYMLKIVLPSIIHEIKDKQKFGVGYIEKLAERIS